MFMNVARARNGKVKSLSARGRGVGEMSRRFPRSRNWRRFRALAAGRGPRLDRVFPLTFPAARRVFCPWSALNFLNQPSRGFRNYWYQSGGQASVLMQRLRSHRFDHPPSYGVPHALQLSFLEAFPTLKELSLESLWIRTGCMTIQRRALEGLVRRDLAWFTILHRACGLMAASIDVAS